MFLYVEYLEKKNELQLGHLNVTSRLTRTFYDNAASGSNCSRMSTILLSSLRIFSCFQQYNKTFVLFIYENEYFKFYSNENVLLPGIHTWVLVQIKPVTCMWIIFIGKKKQLLFCQKGYVFNWVCYCLYTTLHPKQLTNCR